MISLHLPASEQVPCYLGAFFVTYILLVGLGRILKRRAGIRLGLPYQLLSLVLSIYLPFEIFGDHPDFAALRELRAAAILLGGAFVLALVRRYVWEGYFERTKQIIIPKLLRDIVAIVVFVFCLVLVLTQIYGQGAKTLTGLLAGSGIVAVVLGFAMQDLLGNIISGISLQISRAFSEGDWLKIDNQFAEVMEVNWRSTRLRTNDHIYLELPNSYIVKNTIVNLNYHTPEYAMRIRIGIDYNVPPNTVKDALIQAASTVSGVLSSPPPKALLIDFGDSSIIYEVKFWMNNHALYNDICSGIRTNAWYELKRRNINIPFPIRTLQIERKGQPQKPVSALHRTRLRKQSFFQCLDDTQMDQIFSTAPLCRFGKDEEMVRQGAEGDSMFVILHGTAGVYIKQNGASARVAVLGEGEFFGEMSLLTGEARNATVKAEVDCEVIKVDKEHLCEIVQASPGLLERLSEMLAQRKVETESAKAALLGQEALQAVKAQYTAGFLSKLYKMFEL